MTFDEGQMSTKVESHSCCNWYYGQEHSLTHGLKTSAPTQGPTNHM
jgi:hypothetical protein